MRVAAIYDIHGNLQALESVLRDIARENVDCVVVGGDLAWGPFPAQTLDALRRLRSALFIRGNADREVAGRFGTDDGLDDIHAAINEWAADQLSPEQRRWLANLDATTTTSVVGLGDVFYCHGSPRSDEEMITPLSPDERLSAALQGVASDVVVCGHTHMQFQRDVAGHHIVNPGSVGLSYDGRPGACWAILGPTIDLRTTAYDLEGTAEAMRRSGCPHVEDVFVDTILHPPDPTDVARQFEEQAARQRY